MRAARSLDIGSVRLTERLMPSDPPTADRVEAATPTVDEALDTLPSYGVHVGDARTLVGVAGTVTTSGTLLLGLDPWDRERVHQHVPVADVHELVERLLAMSVAERESLGVPTGRSDVIGAGALILDRVLRRSRCGAADGLRLRHPRRHRLVTRLTQDGTRGFTLPSLGTGRPCQHNRRANKTELGSDPTLGALVHDLTEQMSTLVRDEMRLAQAEMTQKGKTAGIGIGLFSGAGLIAFFGLGRADRHGDPRARPCRRRMGRRPDRDHRALRHRRRPRAAWARRTSRRRHPPTPRRRSKASSRTSRPSRDEADMSTSDIHTNGTEAQQHPTSSTPTTSNDPDDIREDIERTRENLAETVDALHAKLDVKTHAKARIAEVKARIAPKERIGQAKERIEPAKDRIVHVTDQATTDAAQPRPEVVGAAGRVLARRRPGLVASTVDRSGPELWGPAEGSRGRRRRWRTRPEAAPTAAPRPLSVMGAV